MATLTAREVKRYPRGITPPHIRVVCGGCGCKAHPVLLPCNNPCRSRWHYYCTTRKCRNAGKLVHRTSTIRTDS